MSENSQNHKNSTTEEKCYLVDEEFSNMRLDLFLCRQTKDISRQQIQNYIKDLQVQVNGQTVKLPKYKVFAHDEVFIKLAPLLDSPQPEKGKLKVIYQDTRIAIINKPAGLSVHPSPGEPDGTLVNRLVAHFPELADISSFRPGIIHRLDKDTSGLLIISLDENHESFMKELFADRKLDKSYLVLVHGVPDKKDGSIDEAIGRHPQKKVKMAIRDDGKNALSHYKTLYADPEGRFSLLEVEIVTGRTHQIRVHLAHMGHPVMGDKLYRTHRSRELEEDYTAPRQMLHAWKLSFHYPASMNERGEIKTGLTSKNQSEKNSLISLKENTFRACVEPPEDFFDAIKALTYQSTRVVIVGMPASGKSSLLNFLKDEYPVFSADKIVSELYQKGADGWALIKARFGHRFLKENGELDKKILAQAMQESAIIRREIEELIHPLVQYSVQKFWDKNKKAKLSFAEIPLYCEIEGQGADFLVGVSSPFEMRSKRLKETRGWSEELIQSMESWQWPEEKKMAACQLVVENTGTKKDFLDKCQKLKAMLINKASEKNEKIQNEIFYLWSCK